MIAQHLREVWPHEKHKLVDFQDEKHGKNLKHTVYDMYDMYDCMTYSSIYLRYSKISSKISGPCILDHASCDSDAFHLSRLLSF